MYNQWFWIELNNKRNDPTGWYEYTHCAEVSSLQWTHVTSFLFLIDFMWRPLGTLSSFYLSIYLFAIAQKTWAHTLGPDHCTISLGKRISTGPDHPCITLGKKNPSCLESMAVRVNNLPHWLGNIARVYEVKKSLKGFSKYKTPSTCLPRQSPLCD